MPRYEVEEFGRLHDDFSLGVIGNLSEVGRTKKGASPRHFKKATNAIFPRRRAVDSRPGSRDISAAAFDEIPHSLAKFYKSGANKLFVGTDDGASGGNLWRLTATGRTVQTLPYTPSDRWFRRCMFNGVLIQTQMGGTQKPIFYDSTNPAETWLTCALPKPGFPVIAAGATVTGTGIPGATTVLSAVANGAATLTLSANATATTSPVTLTIGGVAMDNCSTTSGSAIVTRGNPTFNADSAGGSLVDTGVYYWRVRYRYNNGSSLVGPISAAHTMATPNLTANLNIPIPVGTARADYVGWTLERTKATGASDGPFYVVADGTAATYADGKADADLWTRADETLHGEPPHLEGIIAHKGRLFGWANSILYMSQPILGREATGIFNWVGDAFFQVSKDDGDVIQNCEVQADRLVILKTNSIHSLEGDDIDSFRLVVRDPNVGCCSPRATCVDGSDIFFAGGQNRLFVLSGNRVQQVAVIEMGEYIDRMDMSRDDQIVVHNHHGDYILVCYTNTGDALNEDQIVFDLQNRTWTHFNGWTVADLLSMKDDADFGGARLLCADPSLRSPAEETSSATNPSFMVWESNEVSSIVYQVMVQKFDSDGAEQWTAGGVQVGANSTGAVQAAVLALDDGGCVVVWEEIQSGSIIDVFVQRFDSAGVKQWTASGVNLTSYASSSVHANSSVGVRIVTDDTTDGCIVAWGAIGSNIGAWVQRLDGTGAALWTAGGVKATTALANTPMRIFKDGLAGVFVFCSDGTVTRMQNVDATGTVLLAAAGVSVATGFSFGICADPGSTDFFVAHTPSTLLAHVRRVTVTGTVTWTSPNYQVSSFNNGERVVPDGAGGCVVVWIDGSGAATNVRAHRISSAGALVWASRADIQIGGRLTLSPALNYGKIWAIPDGSGGAIFAWATDTGGSTTTTQLYAAQINNSGTTDWATSPIQLAALSGFEHGVMLATDAAGGAIIGWGYAPVSLNTNEDAYIQRVTSAGLTIWTAGGNLVTGAANNQIPRGLVFTGAPEGEYLPTLEPGYHVYSLFDGVLDRRAVDGTQGDPLYFEVETPDIDEGVPTLWKDYEHVEFILEEGDGTIVGVMTFGDGVESLTIPIDVVSRGPTYDSGFLYDDGVYYATEGELRVSTGVPIGTSGKSYRIRVAGNIIAATRLTGFTVSGYILPQREYS